MSSKVVNVVLSSTNALTGNTQQANYFIDWSSILKNDKEYYLHFTYLGGANTITGTKIAILYADFQTSNFKANAGGAPSTQILGFLMPTVLQGSSSTSYLQSLDNTNSPTYLKHRPTNNNFTISIYDSATTPSLFLDNAAIPAIPASYMLVLSFREVDEDNL